MANMQETKCMTVEQIWDIMVTADSKSAYHVAEKIHAALPPDPSAEITLVTKDCIELANRATLAEIQVKDQIARIAEENDDCKGCKWRNFPFGTEIENDIPCQNCTEGQYYEKGEQPKTQLQQKCDQLQADRDALVAALKTIIEMDKDYHSDIAGFASNALARIKAGQS